MEFAEAKNVLIDKVKSSDVESVDIENTTNRILAENLIADKDVPQFNRSPLDGYCFNYIDTKNASEKKPIYFDIIDEVPCGKVATKRIDKLTTIKLMTGAKMPEGANCVIKYEDVVIENGKLKLTIELSKNQNVILAGEDAKNGDILIKKGNVVDMGVVGIASSLGKNKLKVYKKIKIGFISTGSELLELNEKLTDGKIYNSNRYIFDAILKKYNVEYKYYGIVYDNIEEIKKAFDKASNECDLVISTGGVSVGDYDLVDKALMELGFNIFVKGIAMKPGMACCFAEKKNKIILGLSGNPMSSVTTFYTVVLPAIKKMMGYTDFENHYFKVKLKNSFSKKIKKLRFLRANVDIENGEAVATLNLDQGNIVIKSLIGCNAMIKVENVEEAKAGMVFDCMLI